MTEVRRRRRRFPMGGATTPRVEGSVADDLDDGSDDPEVNDLNERAEALTLQTDVGQDDEAFTPANRLRQVGDRASGYEREFRLKLLNRLIMRNLPLDVIAAELRVSMSTVQRDRQELYRRLRTQASRMDGNELIGDTLSFYSEIQGMALRMASGKTADNIKLAAMRTALTSRNDRHRFYQASGVFDVLQFSSDQDSSSSDLERLSGMVDKLIAQDDDVDIMSGDSGLDVQEFMAGDAVDEEELEMTLF